MMKKKRIVTWSAVTAGVTRLVSMAPAPFVSSGPSLHPDIAANGSVIAYQSSSTTLVPGDAYELLQPRDVLQSRP